MEDTRQPTSATPAVARLVAVYCLAACAFLLVGFVYRDWLPVGVSKHGQQIDAVLRHLLWTTFALFVVGHLAIGIFIWKSVSRPAGEHSPQLSRKTEWLWILLPLVCLAGLVQGGALWIGRSVHSELSPTADEEAISVEIIGKQYEWFARYPGRDGILGETRPELVQQQRNPLGLDKKDPAARDDVISRGILRLPIDVPVHLKLRTYDVQHSLAITAMRVKQDLVPGMATWTRFVPTVEGEYEINCAELCGLGHYKMQGVVSVLSPEAYREWNNKQIGWFE